MIEKNWPTKIFIFSFNFLQVMAGRILTLAARSAVSRAPLGAAQIHHVSKIGNRDVVGYGWNGQTAYVDRLDYPFPPIRFKENTPDVLVSVEQLANLDSSRTF